MNPESMMETEWQDAENCILVDQDPDGHDIYFTTDGKHFRDDWSMAVDHQVQLNREDLKEYKDKTEPLLEVQLGTVRKNLE